MNIWWIYGRPVFTVLNFLPFFVNHVNERATDNIVSLYSDTAPLYGTVLLFPLLFDKSRTQYQSSDLNVATISVETFENIYNQFINYYIYHFRLGQS